MHTRDIISWNLLLTIEM